MNEKVRGQVENRGGRIDAFYYCPHLPEEEGCPCRKPKTGMIEKAVRDFEVDLGRSRVVGDSAVDVDRATLSEKRRAERRRRKWLRKTL